MGSIPLVALQANTNQPGPLDQYAKAMQLKQLMNANALAPGQQQLQQGQLGLQQKQLQAADIENQKGQQELAQTAAINDAYKRAVTVDPTTGAPKFDTDELSKALAASGHGSAIPSILENITKYDTAHTDLLSKQTKLQTEAADAMGNVGAAIKAANYDPRLTTTIIQHALQQPNLPPQQAQQYQQMSQQIQQNPAVVKQIADQLLASSPEQRKLSASDQEAQARADQAKTGSERLAAELPGGALEPVDKAEFQEFVKSHPNSKTPAQDFAKWKASLAPQAQINVGGGSLNTSALDQAAEKYFSTGTLPAMGMGAAGAAIRRQIMNRAGELHPEGNLAANSAEYKANQGSLTNLQKNFDQVTAFENTAGKNLDQFLKTAQSVVDTNSPLVNLPLRVAAGRVAGSPQQAAFEAARNTALTEISKVLNSSNASGVLSDSARSEVSSLIGKDATLKQIVSAAQILKTDMANRHQAYQDQISDIQGRLGGAVQGGGQSSNAASPEKPVYHNGKLLGYTKDGKTISRLP